MDPPAQAPLEVRVRRIAAAPRARALAASVPVALAVLLAAGVALRVALALVYRPPVLNLIDTLVYVDMAENELFSDPSRAVGYSLLLRLLHAISAHVDVTILLQHLMGIATALLLYATVRRIGAPRWVALAPAAAVLLSLDQVFLEHTLMPEAPFAFSLAAVLYAAVRALDESRALVGPLNTRLAWIAAAGALLGLSAWLRPAAAPLIPFLALWFALAISAGWRARVGNAALGGAAATLVLLGYFALHSASTGHFGLSEASGWALYSRTAPFADCNRFDPPPGTGALCEATSPEQRPGPDFYGWENGSPARRLFGGQPAGDDKLAAFAQAAILHQPIEYLKDVTRDMARYFLELPGKPYGGVGYDVVEVDRRAPGSEEDVLATINSYFADEPLSIHGGLEELGKLQDVMRVRNTLLLVALLFAVAGLPLSRGRVRAGLILLLGGALLAMAVPVATAIYNARYAIPATGPLAAAGAMGAWLVLDGCLQRLEHRSGVAGSWRRRLNPGRFPSADEAGHAPVSTLSHTLPHDPPP